ncbi:uncharacterized protein F4822DRAFT_422080 [Hypoxylon trugodes]|uniref:uncharacterized protein n=1 Tax=Hypoxylon trugodes TaxID=326681 RepID=UPI00219634E0|nr:uncharacterized protein F4822DRAFT_422080 [Hypoxylon trugodes]KAI1383068.1 hypothetical protein F4822DRAFT_422080 [Hypoxylon trugodes]
MAAEQDEPKSLILDLYQDDDAEDQFCKGIMEALVDGSRTPSELATTLDNWVVQQSSGKLRELSERPDLIERDEDGHISRRDTPNASGFVDHFFQSFPNLCPVFPPYHAGQTRVIEFLQALMAMPEHKAPDYFLDGGSLDDVQMISLWSDKGYLPEWFRIGADAIRHPGSGVETPGSESEARWRNYQSVMARIAVIGFSDCGFTSALRDILPDGKNYPSIRVRMTSKPEKIGGHVQGAAQWVMRSEEARYVYQQCQKKEKVDKANPRDTWSLEHWKIWKAQFQLFADDERVDARAREAAKTAVDTMEAIEK